MEFELSDSIEEINLKAISDSAQTEKCVEHTSPQIITDKVNVYSKKDDKAIAKILEVSESLES